MDLEEDRNLQKYYLYENERKLLAGQPGEINLDQEAENRARRRITNKRLPNLPKRIQALVDDVALLDTGGFLDSEYWSDGWRQLIDIQPRMQLERDSEFVEPHIWMPNIQFDDEVRLGYTIGQMLRSLSSVTDTDVDYNGLGWGFVLGIFGEPRTNFDREYRKSSDFLYYAIRELSQKKERASEMDEIMEMGSIEEDISRYPSFDSIASFIERENKAKEARTEYKHATSPDSELGYLGLLDSVLAASDEELDQIRELISQIQRSIHLVNDTQSGHLSAKEVFHEAWKKNSHSVDRDSIKKICNTSKGQVTEIMNNFGNNSTSEKWKDEPPLVKGGDGRVNREWSLTNLGYVVGFSMFEEDGTEFVYRAIAQVLTDQQAQHELHERIAASILEL